uniref:C2H2-type domain-containing protein n=1 Tax=Manihot esculenta TaxID=3983 RepID=A0A2C9WNP3_MANES
MKYRCVECGFAIKTLFCAVLAGKHSAHEMRKFFILYFIFSSSMLN